MTEPTKIDISTGIIFKTILILLGLGFLYLVRDVILLLFIAVIIVSAIEPAIDWLENRKVRRTFGVLFVYLVMFSILGVAISFLIPPIANQINDFSRNFPKYYESAQNSFGLVNDFFQEKHINISTPQFFENLSNFLKNIPSRIFSTTVGVFSGLISVVVVLSLSFYMSIEKDSIKKFIVSIVPEKHKDYAADLTFRIKHKIGRWMIGQLALMFLVFLFVYIGLTLVGVPYALLLAVLAGLMEIVPYVGPIVSAVPGVILGFMVSPTVGFLALGVYIASQQFENHVIVPLVMKKAVGLSPITVILVLLIGAKLAGAMGAILAIPVATALSLFISDMKEKI